MNDLYKPVDVQRLMELAGTKKLPEADVPTDYYSLASPEVQANYNKGGQRPDITDPIIASRMGHKGVPQADIARAAQTRPEGPTATVPTATPAPPPVTAPFPEAPAAAASGASTTPAAPAAPAAAPAAPAAVATRPAYAGSAGSQAIQKLNPDLIKDVNKIYPGQEFKLPGGGTYTVQKGDTLDAIARRTAPTAASSGRLQQLAAPGPGTTPAAAAANIPNSGRGDTPGYRDPRRVDAAPVATQPAAPAASQTRQQRLDAMTPAQRHAIYPPRLDQLLYGKAATDAARAKVPSLEETTELSRMQSLAGIRKP